MRRQRDERPAKRRQARREGGKEAALREHDDGVAPQLEDARRPPQWQAACDARTHHLELVAAGCALGDVPHRPQAKIGSELGERAVPVLDRLVRKRNPWIILRRDDGHRRAGHPSGWRLRLAYQRRQPQQCQHVAHATLPDE